MKIERDVALELSTIRTIAERLECARPMDTPTEDRWLTAKASCVYLTHINGRMVSFFVRLGLFAIEAELRLISTKLDATQRDCDSALKVISK